MFWVGVFGIALCVFAPDKALRTLSWARDEYQNTNFGFKLYGAILVAGLVIYIFDVMFVAPAAVDELMAENIRQANKLLHSYT